MRRQYRDYELDALLREQLADALDAQAGRARRAFEAEFCGAAKRPARVGGRAWKVSAFGGALAASLAALWAVPRVWRPHVPGTVNVAMPVVPLKSTTLPAPLLTDSGLQWERVSQVVSTVAQDKGVVVLEDETPARIVRRVSMERTEWVDPKRGVRVEVVVPREKVMLIATDTY